MGIISKFDVVTSSRTLVWIVQVVVIGIVVIGTILFFYSIMIPTISEIEKSVTETVIINASSHNVCKIITSDKKIPTKTLTNCDMEVGKKITVNYKEGFPIAKIIEP